MPPKKSKKCLNIIRVPLGFRPTFKPINFPPMPQLYLDLLENKDKVHSHLKEIYYEPKWDDQNTQFLDINMKEVEDAALSFKKELVKDYQSAQADIDGLRFGAVKQTKRKFSTSTREDFSRPYEEASKDNNSPHGSWQKYADEPVPKRDRPTLGVLNKYGSGGAGSAKKFTTVNEDGVAINDEKEAPRSGSSTVDFSYLQRSGSRDSVRSHQTDKSGKRSGSRESMIGTKRVEEKKYERYQRPEESSRSKSRSHSRRDRREDDY